MLTLLMTMMLGVTPPDRVMRVVVAPAESLHVEISGSGPVVGRMLVARPPGDTGVGAVGARSDQ